MSKEDFMNKVRTGEIFEYREYGAYAKQATFTLTFTQPINNYSYIDITAAR